MTYPITQAVRFLREKKVDFTLDLLLVTEALPGVWDARELVSWEDGETYVVSKDGRIAMKMISGREQDLLDIKKLREVSNES